MSEICLARIDDRLIHGQIVIKWWKYLHCDEILIADDDVAGDPFMQEVLSLAGPPDVPVRVLSVGDAACRLATQDGNRRSTLLLVKSPLAALRLMDKGVRLSHINVGGLAAGEGTQRVFRNVSLDPLQADALEELSRRGVQITFQLIPGDAQAEWTTIRQRLRHAPSPLP